MSAFIINPTHIATCAAIVREFVLDYENEPPNDVDIRMDLAIANVISVAWRYRPLGAAAYAPILTSLVGKPDDPRFDANGSQAQLGISDINETCFDDGYTVSRYFEDCKAAQAIPYSEAEACMYLSCFDYQSCETPGWKGSKVHGWTQQAKCVLAYRLASHALGAHRVWEARKPEAVTVAL